MEISKVIEQAKAFIIAHNSGINTFDLYKDFDNESCDYIEDYEYAERISEVMGADKVEFGATKVVLFYKDMPHWVVKIPTFGRHNFLYDEELEEYEEDAEEPYTDFMYALEDNDITMYSSIPVSDRDYCSVEAAMYKEAEDRGLGDCFAPTYFVVSMDGVPFYISRNYSISCWDGNDKSEISDEIMDEADGISWKYDDTFSSIQVIAAILNYWNVETLQDLNDFFEEFNINDIHSGNIRYAKVNGEYKPGIIDYSGYHEEF